MSAEIPYGDANGMREYARKLRVHADSVENILAPISLPPTDQFRGRVADSFRMRREELRSDARRCRDQLNELAGWLERSAAQLQEQIDDAHRRAREAERRRQQMFNFPWRR